MNIQVTSNKFYSMVSNNIYFVISNLSIICYMFIIYVFMSPQTSKNGIMEKIALVLLVILGFYNVFIKQ